MNLLYPIFITQDRVIKMAEVAGGTEESVQMCRYAGLLLARRCTECTSERVEPGRAVQMDAFLRASSRSLNNQTPTSKKKMLRTKLLSGDFAELVA